MRSMKEIAFVKQQNDDKFPLRLDDKPEGEFLDFDIHICDDGGTAGAQTLCIGFGGVHPATGTLFTASLGDTDG